MTILREDVWKAASTKPYSLDTPGPPVVVANGETLDLLGQTTVSLKVAGVKVNHPCLVTSELTQECIIGADFLLENKCIIDLCNQALLAGGQTVQFLVDRDSRSVHQFVTSSFQKPLCCQGTPRCNFHSPYPQLLIRVWLFWSLLQSLLKNMTF